VNTLSDEIIQSRAGLVAGTGPVSSRKVDEEGGCGVVGFAASVQVPGRHIFQPSIQMHNRGNGKGGGIAAAGLSPAYFGVTQEILDDCYLLQVAYLDVGVMKELEKNFITPFLDVAHLSMTPVLDDYRSLGLVARPPDVKRYFVRVKPAALRKFATTLPGLKPRQVEDEFMWQNSFKINRRFYASLGEKKAFVLSHARNLLILKIVGYAEHVVQYYRMEEMPAHVWIAHQRFPTKGRVWHPGGAHPFIGMNEALVHNGDFANYYSVCEYLKQRNMVPQFLTDTEVSVMIFDLWSRVYQYPLEYVIEGLAPTTELDFDRLPEDKRRLYGAIQAAHIHGSPDGPWFFIIASSHPDRKEFQLMGITDTSMLRPQVFALSDGPAQVGVCASEKQAIDAVLESLAASDARFNPVADKYWNARGGSHTDGGAFVFTLSGGGRKLALACTNKFGAPIVVEPGLSLRNAPKKRPIRSRSKVIEGVLSPELEMAVRGHLKKSQATQLFESVAFEAATCDFKILSNLVELIVSEGTAAKSPQTALDGLTLLNDWRYALGKKRRSSTLEIIRKGVVRLLDGVSSIANGNGSGNNFRRITFSTRDKLRAPAKEEATLVIDARGFSPEGTDCDAMTLVKAAELGWKRFVIYGLHGQRFHACGLGPETAKIRVDLYGSSGDYAGSGMDGCELYIHGDAQDQLAQILKRGKLVVYGNVGQTFMYGAKGGSVYVMGNAAGRPLINAVGCPRVVINGTSLDFLAESFMAGDALNGGGFVIVNGLSFRDDGSWQALPLPYPGSNLFSLASGGALYIRDPRQTVIPQQLNGGRLTELTKADWALIKPYLKENERLFRIKLDDLLTVDGTRLPPVQVYRKIMPVQASILERELADEDE
jgi:glutamate synthase domain-containing protein 1/glutamate synthase domain-containing protein 3